MWDLENCDLTSSLACRDIFFEMYTLKFKFQFDERLNDIGSKLGLPFQLKSKKWASELRRTLRAARASAFRIEPVVTPARHNVAVRTCQCCCAQNSLRRTHRRRTILVLIGRPRSLTP